MKLDMKEFFLIAKQALAAKGTERKSLLSKLADLAARYSSKRSLLHRPFCEGRAIVWSKAVTAEPLGSSKFDYRSASTAIGCDKSRILKYLKDIHCREALGLGIILGIAQWSGHGIKEDVPYSFHSAIAGLCRAVPTLADDRLTRNSLTYLPRHKVISFQAGLVANLLTYRSNFDELLKTDWSQYPNHGRLPSGPRLKLLGDLASEINRQLADYPRFSEAVGNIHISNLAEYLTEAIPYLGWWLLACEILWELLDDSGIAVLRIFDPFAGLQDHSDDFKWN